MTLSLRGLRHNKGLTAKAAAEQIDISHDTLLNAERGDRVPGVTFKHKIASFYGVEVTDIWPVTEHEEQAA